MSKKDKMRLAQCIKKRTVHGLERYTSDTMMANRTSNIFWKVSSEVKKKIREYN